MNLVERKWILININESLWTLMNVNEHNWMWMKVYEKSERSQERSETKFFSERS